MMTLDHVLKCLAYRQETAPKMTDNEFSDRSTLYAWHIKTFDREIISELLAIAIPIYTTIRTQIYT